MGKKQSGSQAWHRAELRCPVVRAPEARPGWEWEADAWGLAGHRRPRLLLSRRPRTLEAPGSHLKPGNAQTGSPLPPKQFLARRRGMRGVQLKQNDPHLLISSVATKRLAIYAATLNKDIWLFPRKQVHFCMAAPREDSLSPASRPPGCSGLGTRSLRASRARRGGSGSVHPGRSLPTPSPELPRGDRRDPGLGRWGCDVLGKSAPVPEPRASRRWAGVGDPRFV